MEHTGGTPMTRDEALLWLNDRLGRDVTAEKTGEVVLDDGLAT